MSNKPNTEKKSIFGQITLMGLMALDWLKPEGKTVRIKSILMGDAEAFKDLFTIPEWAEGVIAVLYDLDKHRTPILVTQNSVLNWLETMCLEWDGMCGVASLTGTKVNGQIARLVLDDGEERTVNMKKSGPKQFDKYECKIIIEKKKKS